MGCWVTRLLIYLTYSMLKQNKKRMRELISGTMSFRLLGNHWRNVGLAFNCTFLLFGSVIQLIACARVGRSFHYVSSYHGLISLSMTLSGGSCRFSSYHVHDWLCQTRVLVFAHGII